MVEKAVLASASVLAASACFALGMYVMSRNRHLSSSRAFFVVAMMAGLAALFDFLMITSQDASEARLFARGLVLTTTLLAAAMLHLASIMPFERKGSWAVRHRWRFTAAAAAVSAAMAASGIEVAKDKYGWWLRLNAPSLLWYAAVVLIFLASTIVLILAYRGERSAVERRRLLPLIVGMAVPVSSSLLVVLTVMSEAIDPPLLSAIILSTCLFVGYGVLHQKLFILEPVEEDVQRDSSTPGVKTGGSVLVETKTGDLAYRMFVNEIASGGQGLLISRRHPDQLRERYGLMTTPMLWLTTKPGANRIDPSSLTLLLHSVLAFLDKSTEAVILLDGLEYLETYNGGGAVMRFFYGLRDAITVTGSKLIISVDPAALDPQFLPRLEREMSVIEK